MRQRLLSALGGGDMDEAEIKAAVLTQVRRAAGRKPKPVVTTEFSLRPEGVRADLAILAEEFIGVEIKSSGDTLRRLRNQLNAYSLYFDRVILIVADRHIAAVDETWLRGAALWRISSSGSVQEVVPPLRSKNTPQRDVDILTQDEIRKFWQVRSELESPENAAREALFSAFRYRYTRTSEEFWRHVKGRRINSSDLSVLSRYSELRRAQRQHEEDREHFWRRWSDDNHSHKG